MRILALDLGKNKSMFCAYVSGAAAPEFGKIAACPQELHDLLVRQAPEKNEKITAVDANRLDRLGFVDSPWRI